MDAPAQAEMAMVIGNRRVPLAKVRLANSEGEFEEHLLANLSQRPSGPDGKRLLTSIWNVTGGIRPWNAPLVAEIKQAIASLRVKKDRQGNIYGANGKPLPGIVPVKVRGQNGHRPATRGLQSAVRLAAAGSFRHDLRPAL